MRIIYMGTPDFAVPTLKALIDSEHEVIAVFTQPDKPKGRSGQLQMTPVKELALKYDIPVYQPVRIRNQEYVDIIKQMNADIAVVAAFGQILPVSILEAPKYGCINVHASLLPKYRGAAPIQQAILDMEKETGITIQQMGEGVDTGDILLQESFILDGTETGGSLFDKLSLMGGDMVLKVIGSFLDNTVTRTPQDEAKASHVHMIKKEDGHICFYKSAALNEAMIRAYNPWPSAYLSLDNKLFKIWEAKISDRNVPSAKIVAENGRLYLGFSEGALELLSVQLEGKKRMSASDFLRGYSINEDTVLE